MLVLFTKKEGLKGNHRFPLGFPFYWRLFSTSTLDDSPRSDDISVEDVLLALVARSARVELEIPESTLANTTTKTSVRTTPNTMAKICQAAAASFLGPIIVYTGIGVGVGGLFEQSHASDVKL